MRQRLVGVGGRFCRGEARVIQRRRLLQWLLVPFRLGVMVDVVDAFFMSIMQRIAKTPLGAPGALRTATARADVSVRSACWQVLPHRL